MQPDVVIEGRYRLVRRIAVGGMSTVWEAWDERLQRRVALKQLEFRGGLGEEEGRLAAQRALREARITARLHHPNAVAVHDVVDHEGAPCLIMQYLPSTSLQELIADRGALPVEDVVRIGREITAALAAAHEAGIVHRDVKPGNVLIGEDGGARLTDFGISHAYGDATLTSTGIVSGTPAYLAPEVARGEPSSIPSDVYSLGATLYAAVEGTTPIEVSDNPMAVLHRAASGQVRPPQRGTPLEPLLARMLAFDPRQRPSVGEVAAELARLGEAAPRPTAALPADRRPDLPSSTTVALPPVPAASAYPAAPPPRQRRSSWAVAVVVLAVLLVAGLVALVATSLGSDSGGNGNPAAAGTSNSTRSHRISSPAHPSASHPSASPPSKTSPSAEQPTKPKKPKKPTKVKHSPPPPPDATGPDAQIAAVRDYYGLLPGDTHDAWDRLTPEYQNETGGRGNYEKFWHGFQSVAVGNEQYRAGAVLADITYTRSDGSQSSETRSFNLVEDGGILKIAGSQVVG